MNLHLSIPTIVKAAACCAATMLLTGGSAPASTLQVSGTINEALAAAREGDVLLVSGPRVFAEHLLITNRIHLLGTNAPVVDGGGGGTLLVISGAGSLIEGITFRNSGHDLTTLDSGIQVRADSITVRDCVVENDGFGIYLRGANDCSVERNTIKGSKQVPSSARGNGIHLWKAQRNSIVGNIIRDKRDGMYFSYADYNLIAANDVAETRFGIHYMYSHQNKLLTNTLSYNVVGATLMFSRQALVAGNIVTANRRHGIVLKQFDSSKIIGNIVSGQNRGLFVQQANQNRFEGNIVATNDIGLYLSNISEDNVFTGNAFVLNTDQVWQPPFETSQGRKGPNSFSERGRGNYWSDYTGSDRNSDGIGDTPYHETDAFGYIVDRHPAARLFALSPAVTLLRKGEELMPVLDTEGVTDPAPLMKPPAAAAFTKILALNRK